MVEFKLYLQTEISEGKWPSRLNWLQLAQEYNVTFKNKTINSDFGEWAELQLIVKGDSANISLRDFDLISKYVSENYLQVPFFGYFNETVISAPMQSV